MKSTIAAFALPLILAAQPVLAQAPACGAAVHLGKVSVQPPVEQMCSSGTPELIDSKDGMIWAWKCYGTGSTENMQQRVFCTTATRMPHDVHRR